MISLLFGVLYWYVSTKVLPRVRGYVLNEEDEVLDDGTTVTKVVKVPKEFKLRRNID